MLPLQGARVRPLVGELRSACCVVWPKEKKIFEKKRGTGKVRGKTGAQILLPLHPSVDSYGFKLILYF